MTQSDNGSAERMSFRDALQAGCGTPRDRRNQFRMLVWGVGWVATLLAVTTYLNANEEFRGNGAWLLASVPFLVSVGVLMSFLRYLREADEFMRKIQIEGLAIGFGVGIFFTLGYQALEKAGAPEMSANDAVIFMAVGWMVGHLVATWRYR